jgi:hypothetical protein
MPRQLARAAVVLVSVLADPPKSADTGASYSLRPFSGLPCRFFVAASVRLQGQTARLPIRLRLRGHRRLLEQEITCADSLHPKLPRHEREVLAGSFG